MISHLNDDNHQYNRRRARRRRSPIRPGIAWIENKLSRLPHHYHLHNSRIIWSCRREEHKRTVASQFAGPHASHQLAAAVLGRRRAHVHNQRIVATRPNRCFFSGRRLFPFSAMFQKFWLSDFCGFRLTINWGPGECLRIVFVAERLW
jgi:hypothetical protein